MRYMIGTMLVLFLLSTRVFAGSGLVNVKSTYDVKLTADRFEAGFRNEGMILFCRIDHAANAAKVGEKIRPMDLLIFGNPAVGTKLIECSQTIGIDLPLKALIWEDEKGVVWVSYNEPKYLANRHSITGCNEVLKKIEAILDALARSASGS